MNKVLRYILSSLFFFVFICSYGQEQLVKTALKGPKRLFKVEAKNLAKEGVEVTNKTLVKDAFKAGSEEIGKNYMKEATAKQLIRGAVRKNILKEIEEKELGSILHYGMLNAKKKIAQTEKCAVKRVLSKNSLDNTYGQSIQKLSKDIALIEKKKVGKAISEEYSAILRKYGSRLSKENYNNYLQR